jgi:streptomycin 6-kinase
VSERFAAAVDGWGLRDPRWLGGGYVALVFEATRDRRPVVLKVNPGGHPDAAQLAGEAAALAFWEPTGAVPKVYGSRDGGLTILLERLVPGTVLERTSIDWDDRLAMLGGLAATLHERRRPADVGISMSEFTRDWRGALAGEPELLAELDELIEPADDDVLVHADLHGGNVLLHGEDWKVIDPKSVRGDRHADIWALIEPDAPPLPTEAGAAAGIAWGRVERYARAAGMDPERAGAWARVRALAESAWVSDEWAGRLRAMAKALGPGQRI